MTKSKKPAEKKPPTVKRAPAPKKPKVGLPSSNSAPQTGSASLGRGSHSKLFRPEDLAVALVVVQHRTGVMRLESKASELASLLELRGVQLPPPQPILPPPSALKDGFAHPKAREMKPGVVRGPDQTKQVKQDEGDGEEDDDDQAGVLRDMVALFGDDGAQDEEVAAEKMKDPEPPRDNFSVLRLINGEEEEDDDDSDGGEGANCRAMLPQPPMSAYEGVSKKALCDESNSLALGVALCWLGYATDLLPYLRLLA